MNIDDIWNCEERIADLLGVPVPRWIDQDITAATCAAIMQGGCESGAYMPAVTYWQAIETMAAHGDDVVDYILDGIGHHPDTRDCGTWGQIAVLYLSLAVDIWASQTIAQLEDMEEEDA